MRNLNVLLVEDSDVDALLIRESLSDIPDWQCAFERVPTLDEALRRSRKPPPDICLLDLGLPDSQGIDTIRQYVRAVDSVPVLVLTGRDDTDTGVEAVKEGAQDYLVKGTLRAADLERTIRYALERSAMLDELRRSRNRLRKLASRLQNVREEERLRISREIHDDLGQKLTALKLDLGWLGAWLGDQPPDSVAQVKRRLDEALMLSDSLVSDVQRLAAELRPAALDHLGLADAIHEEAHNFQVRTGMGIDLELGAIESDLKLGQRTSIMFFRVFQELVTNVARHAQASEVGVAFHKVDDCLQLSVRDNGVGISPDAVQSDRSLGLLGVSERAIEHNGRILIEGTPGKGSRITVTVPLGNCLD